MGRRFVVMAIGMLLLLLCINTALAAEVTRWHINLGMGYGNYSVSLGEPNEFIQQFNEWTGEVLGIDLGMGKIKDSSPLHSLDWRIDLSPRWRIGAEFNYLPVSDISEFKWAEISLPGGGWKSTNVEADVDAKMGFGDFILYYNFKPGARLTPFAGAGIGYYLLDLDGDYLVWEQTYTPPWDYEYRSLSESFSISDGGLGYVLVGGINCRILEWHFDIDLSLQARYNFAPKLKGELTAENEGFPSLPVAPELFEVNLSGWSGKIWIALRF